MRFVLLLEGATERLVIPAFFKAWLDPQLNRPVRITPIAFKGAARFQSEYRAHVLEHLSRPDQIEIIATVGLLDLYGLPAMPAKLKSVDERYASAEKKFNDGIKDSRFKMFFAVHELEAWLLSDLTIFPPPVQSGLAGRDSRPEDVNFDLPPSRLLRKVYRERLKMEYMKTVHGAELFRKLDPQVASNKCPRLKGMLDWMLQAARQKGH